MGKLHRFREISEFDHVLELTDFQSAEAEKPAGKWHSDIFGNRNPITLELACGKADYTLELARRYPVRNYIGVDIKGARLWKGAKRAQKESLDNVRFLRIYIDHLYEYFAPGEVDEIWITFPDPYPKGSDRDKRLTSEKFLTIYQTVIKDGGYIHLKTDSDRLFYFSVKSLERFGGTLERGVEDIYSETPGDDLLTIKTDYEKRHLKKGKSIKYLNCMLPVKNETGSTPRQSGISGH